MDIFLLKYKKERMEVMKKKILGVGIASILIVILIVLGILFGNKTNKTDQLELNENGKIYLEYLKTHTEILSDEEVIINLFDIDFNGIEELLIYNNKFDEEEKAYYSDYLQIYTIENNEVIKVNESDTGCLISLGYCENEDRYYYFFTKDDKFITIDNIRELTNTERKVTDCDTRKFIEFNKDNLENAFKEMYSMCKNALDEFELTKTYELAKEQKTYNTTNVNNINNENINNENVQKLGDVAKAGDYVNYMGSDTDWRVLTFTKNTINGEENRFVYLINSSYKVSKFESTSYEEILGYLEDTRYYKDNIFLDETLAVEATRTPDASVFRTALWESYSTVPDLFDVGVNINLSGEETVDLNNGTRDKFAYYENGSGKVIGKMEWSKNIRPCVRLLSSVVTSGKNDKGAWMISNSKQNEIITSNTEVRRRSSRR